MYIIQLFKFSTCFKEGRIGLNHFDKTKIKNHFKRSLLSKKSSDVGTTPGRPAICPFVSDLTSATKPLSDFHEIRRRFSVHNAAEKAWGSSKYNTCETYYTERRKCLHVMSVLLYRMM